MWLGAALLLVLIVGGAGGFYAYRARRQAQQNATPTVEKPAQPPESNQPASGPAVTSVQVGSEKANESKTEKKNESSQRTVSSKQRAEKTETSRPATETSKPTTGQDSIPPSTGHDAERNPDRNKTFPPQPSQPPGNPPGRQPGHPPGTGEVPSIRTLPNGTRIVTQPDGTRIVTMPNGTVRVIPPGAGRNRKRP